MAEAKRRGARNLLRLKTALDKGIPEKRLDGTLLPATWNLREFGEGNFRKWAGKLDSGSGGADEEEGMKGRLAETLRYLAEIANRFDLIALQGVRDGLEDNNELKRLLGAWWSILVTDVTGGRQGNRERVAFLSDERKARLGGLAGEVVLPPPWQTTRPPCKSAAPRASSGSRRDG